MDDPQSSPVRRRNMAGPRTWAVARDLYLAGATAAEVAKRLGLTVAAIRQRITREGWSKTAFADARLPSSASEAPRVLQDTPLQAADAGAASPARPDGGDDDEAPVAADAVLHAAARRALRALAAGRASEAAALTKAAEQVSVLLSNLPAPPPSPEDEEAAAVAAWTLHWNTAVRLARAMLEDGNIPGPHTQAAFAWRAENLGPQIAEADLARARAGGWMWMVADEEGRLKPPLSFEDYFRKYVARYYHSASSA